jgi:transcriptional regulator with XRE-family HTH domain/uncharacterized phage-associated protein
MKSPFTGKEMNVVKEWRTMSYRKDEFKIKFHSFKCEDTGEKFEDELFAHLNYIQLVNQYRVKYRIPFPEKIKSIREKYNLSAAKMSEILGFGINGYRQYEGGEVPNQSNAKLIQLVDDPHEFRKLVNLCSSLSEKSIEKLYKTINDLLEVQKREKFERQLEQYFFGACNPNCMTGFKTPDFKKFSEMVVFFVERLEPWKTKLNKLLFYADFMMHKQSGFSISGVQYRAIPMGPVPNNFNSIFEYLFNHNELEICYVQFADGGVGEQFRPCKSNSFNKELFTDDEIKVLELVVDRFKDTTTKEIIEISHKEKAWIDNNEESKLIDYRYSFDLL